jgi:hypothetical protein
MVQKKIGLFQKLSLQADQSIFSSHFLASNCIARAISIQIDNQHQAQQD